MKFALIAALAVVLAVGSESASIAKREIPGELDQYFQVLVGALKTVEDPELSRSYIEQTKTQFQPLVEKLHEQLKHSKIDEQIKPLATSLQAHISDLVQTQVEDMLKFMVDQTKANLQRE